jgi:hypothetical protein
MDCNPCLGQGRGVVCKIAVAAQKNVLARRLVSRLDWRAFSLSERLAGRSLFLPASCIFSVDMSCSPIVFP